MSVTAPAAAVLSVPVIDMRIAKLWKTALAGSIAALFTAMDVEALRDPTMSVRIDGRLYVNPWAMFFAIDELIVIWAFVAIPGIVWALTAYEERWIHWRRWRRWWYGDPTLW